MKFELDCRVLGLLRVPLTVGRVVDLEDDILPVATERLRNTFFTNGALLFSGAFIYYCGVWTVPTCLVVLFFHMLNQCLGMYKKIVCLYLTDAKYWCKFL